MLLSNYDESVPVVPMVCSFDDTLGYFVCVPGHQSLAGDERPVAKKVFQLSRGGIKLFQNYSIYTWR